MTFAHMMNGDILIVDTRNSLNNFAHYLNLKAALILIIVDYVYRVNATAQNPLQAINKLCQRVLLTPNRLTST